MLADRVLDLMLDFDQSRGHIVPSPSILSFSCREEHISTDIAVDDGLRGKTGDDHEFVSILQDRIHLRVV